MLEFNKVYQTKEILEMFNYNSKEHTHEDNVNYTNRLKGRMEKLYIHNNCRGYYELIDFKYPVTDIVDFVNTFRKNKFLQHCIRYFFEILDGNLNVTNGIMLPYTQVIDVPYTKETIHKLAAKNLYPKDLVYFVLLHAMYKGQPFLLKRQEMLPYSYALKQVTSLIDAGLIKCNPERPPRNRKATYITWVSS